MSSLFMQYSTELVYTC